MGHRAAPTVEAEAFVSEETWRVSDVGLPCWVSHPRGRAGREGGPEGGTWRVMDCAPHVNRFPEKGPPGMFNPCHLRDMETNY